MHKHNRVDYFELKATDVAEAKRFYSAAFGWAFKDYGPDYAAILGDEHDLGGIALAATISRGGPLLVLYSDDLEASRKQVRESGGELTVDIFDFPGGRRFHFRDPSGNELAVWGHK